MTRRMDKKTVIFFVQRHGQKAPGPNDLALLTEEGRKQVMQSALNNLSGLTFDALYCSLKFRTLETVVCATSVLENKNNGKSVITMEGFDYSSAPDLDKFNDFAAEVKRRSIEENRPINVALWMMVAPTMIDYMRGQMIVTIKDVAIETVRNNYDDKNELYVLVGCHSPVSELACVDLSTMPMLQEADMIKYTVEVDSDNGWDGAGVFATIISSEYVPRGF